MRLLADEPIRVLIVKNESYRSGTFCVATISVHPLMDPRSLRPLFIFFPSLNHARKHLELRTSMIKTVLFDQTILILLCGGRTILGF